MKNKFLYLVALTLLAVLTVVLVTRTDLSKQSGPNESLLSAVATQINSVEQVEIITGGNLTIATLVKSGAGWQLEQLGGYRANWPALQALLADLAQARIIEPKTDKPEYYVRLGVEDITTEDATGVMVNLSIGAATTVIVIGKQAQGRQGRYVRLQNAAASVLVDQKLEVSTRLLDWADASIIDVGSDEVAEVEIIHPAGESVLVTRVSADQTDFNLVGLPPGREINSSWAVNSLGSVFTSLKMESVRPEGDVDWGEAVRMRLLMFSGVEIMADMVTEGEIYLVRLRASHPASNVVIAAQADTTTSDLEQKAALELAATVSNINERLGGWAYGIARYKHEALVKKPEDLLKPLESS